MPSSDCKRSQIARENVIMREKGREEVGRGEKSYPVKWQSETEGSRTDVCTEKKSCTAKIVVNIWTSTLNKNFLKLKKFFLIKYTF